MSTVGSASLACVGSQEENAFLRDILVPGIESSPTHTPGPLTPQAHSLTNRPQPDARLWRLPISTFPCLSVHVHVRSALDRPACARAHRSVCRQRGRAALQLDWAILTY